MNRSLDHNKPKPRNKSVLMRVKNKSALEVGGRLQKKGRKALPIEDLSRG